MPITYDDVDPTFDPSATASATYTKPDDRSVLGAGFRESGTVGSAVMHIKEQWGTDNSRDPNFDPFEDDYLKGYEDYSKRFVHVRNKERADAVKSSIDRESRDLQTIEDAGIYGTLAQIAASIVDPITLAGIVLMPEVIVPGKIGLSIAKMGAVGTADTAVREAVLNPTQETRTAEQSMFNIVAGTLVSGALGGAAGKLTKPQFDKLVQDTAEHLAGKPQGNGQVSMGAAASDIAPVMTTLEQEGLDIGVPGRVAGKIANWADTSDSKAAWVVQKAIYPFREISPNVSLAQSPVKSVRETAQELGIDGLQRPKHFDGVATSDSVELNIMSRVNKDSYSLYEKMKDQVVNMKKSTNINGDDLADELARAGIVADRAEVIKNPTKFLEKSNFNKLVSEAMRNGDQSSISQVANVAKHVRSIYDTYKADLIQMGKLSADADGSYLTRIWDVNKVRAGQTKLQDIIKKWLNETQGITDYDGGLIAEEFINKLMKVRSGANIHMADALGEAGSMKARTFEIPDQLVRDFIENDIEKIVARYTKSMATDIELTKKFGSKNMTERLDDIVREYGDLKAKVQEDMKGQGIAETKIEKALAKIDDAREKDLENIRFMRDKIIGIADIPNDNDQIIARSAKVLRSLIAVKALGDVVLSSVVDIWRNSQVHGFRRMTKVVWRDISHLDVRSMSRKDVRRMGVGLDLINNSRFKKVADISDDFGDENAVERFVNNVSDKFAWWTGMPLWNAELKQFSGVLTSDRILEDVARWGSLKAKDRGFLAKIGIDSNTAERIAEQFKNHGEIIDGYHAANIDDWADQAVANVYEKAILKATEIIINTPHAGTLPKYMNTYAGKTIMQFKSFLMTQYEQTLLAGLGARDSAFWIGSAAAVFTGALVSEIKSAKNGRPGAANATELLYNGVEASGLLSVPMEINNVAHKAGLPSFNGMLDIEGSRRFADRTGFEALFGPTAGMITGMADAGKAIRGSFSGENDVDKAYEKTGKLLPFQNIYGLRPYQMIYDWNGYSDRINENFDQTFGQSWE